jgi:hypothetical protein
MTDFVLDNSVAMRWLLETSKVADQHYAGEVLDSHFKWLRNCAQLVAP